MKVQEALLVEGTSKVAILCYGIFPINKLEVVFESICGAKRMDSKVYKFHDVSWPNSLVLHEILVTRLEETLSAAAEALAQMANMTGCLASVCMYDGAFGDYDDIFAPEFAHQTYAFCLVESGPTITLDEDLLASKEWGSIIANARQLLGEKVERAKSRGAEAREGG